MRKAIPVMFLSVLIAASAAVIGCSKDDGPVEPPKTCSIEMVSPTGGSTYYTGDPVNIRWNTSGYPSTVDIELVRGALDTFIVQGTANSGFYPWTFRAYGYGTHDDYQIRVTGTGQAACFDTTAQFTLVSLSGCQITFPYSSKDTIPTQTAGDVFTIEWTGVNTSNVLQLELWNTSFAPAFTPEEPYFVIDPAVEDDGSYDWTVNSFNNSDDAIYRWRLRDVHLGTCVATSYQFRLIDNELCAIVIGGIDKGVTYDPGSTLPITVIGTNLPGNVDMVLVGSGGPLPGGTMVEDFDPMSGPYLWTVTDYGYTGTNAYRVRVTSTDDPYCSAVSDQFSIAR